MKKNSCGGLEETPFEECNLSSWQKNCVWGSWYLLAYWLQIKPTKAAFREGDVGWYPFSVNGKQTQSTSSTPSGNCVCVSQGCVLSLWQFDAPRLGVIQKDTLKFNYKVLRLKKEKLLANSIKTLRTKKLIIFKQIGGEAWQMSTHVCKYRFIPSQIQQNPDAEIHKVVNFVDFCIKKKSIKKIKTSYGRRQRNSPRLS